MKLLWIYKWFTGSMSDFTKPFEENDVLFNQAKAFWHRLDSFSIVTIAICVIAGILLAITYYKPYNDVPGRHYKPSHWCFFLIGTFVLTLVVTFIAELILVHPSISGATMLEFRVALGNAIFASGLYFVVSLAWCNLWPTNAYRFLKFKL